MSTKTLTKRIALVAAAALALGGVSVLTATSASAIAPTVAYTTMYDTTNGYQVVGGQATVTIGFDSTTIATVASSGVGTIVSATPDLVAGVAVETLTAVTATGFQYNSNTDSGSDPYDSVTVVLSSAVAGTQTLTITPLGANGVPGTAVSKNITWTSSGTTAAASWSTYLIDTTTGTGSAAQLADSLVALSKDKGTAGGPAQVALVVGKLKDGNGNAVTGATVSVTLSGPGLISAVADGDGLVASPATPSQRVAGVTTVAGGYVVVALSGDGTAGVSTVTLTSGTVSTSRSVTFTGAAASYTLTSLTGTYGVGTYGTNDSLTASGLKVNSLDSAGGAVVSGTFYVTSSNLAVATVSSAAHNNAAAGQYVAITGVSAGKSTITVQNGATAATSTVSKTIEIEVTSGTAATVAMSLDKADYQPGEPGVLSITLTNAAGRPVADGTYTIFAATTPLTSNLFMQTNSAGSNGAFASGATAVTTKSGVAAYDIYAPSFSGTLNITATTIGTSTVSSALANTSAVRGVTVAATANISGGSADANASLALDAANAATDAANNAYDEAQNATQAASDALAAVTALAKQVKTLIANVKKLTKAVAKLR